MFIAPSLLEYSVENLEDKLYQTIEKSADFEEITNQNQPLHLHLDFVLEKFALAREVEPSLELNTFFEVFDKVWSEQAILQVHLMGEDEDMQQAKQFFCNCNFNPQITYQILVRPQEIGQWQKEFEGQKNVEIGVWYDLGQWEARNQFGPIQTLIMTVKAGKSGQKLTENTKTFALGKVTTNYTTQFIVDGGWPIDFESSLDNLSVVSYSSFWKVF